LCSLLLYIRPTLSEKDIPSRTTLTDEIYTESLECKEAMKLMFAACDSEVHLTFDAGTSKATDPYFTITASFIKDNGDDWEPVSTIIAFRKIDGSHNGINFGNLLFEVIEEYGLVYKVRFYIEYSVRSKLTVSHSWVIPQAITPPLMTSLWTNWPIVSRMLGTLCQRPPVQSSENGTPSNGE
jgi:hypothetical protein